MSGSPLCTVEAYEERRILDPASVGPRCSQCFCLSATQKREALTLFAPVSFLVRIEGCATRACTWLPRSAFESSEMKVRRARALHCR